MRKEDCEFEDLEAEAPELSLIEQMNARYAFIKNRGGHSAILEQTTDADGKPLLDFRSIHDFEKDEATIKIPVRNAHGAKNLIPVGKWWREHPQRRTYKGLAFKPDEGSEVNGYLNLWQGFAVKPVKGDWNLMRKHIETIIANGNAEHARYIIRWIAWVLQNPGEVGEVALVLLSEEEGTGKGFLGRALRQTACF